MADETTQDPTQHDDAATETAPAPGAEFSPADGAGHENAADGSVQPLPATDASPTELAAADAPAADSEPTTATGDAAPAAGAEGGSPAESADPVADNADAPAAEPTADAAESVVPGLNAEPASVTEGAEPAVDDHLAASGADVSGPATADAASEAAPAAAPTDADAADAQPAPADSDAAKEPDAAAGGDVELPFNSAGMAQLGTTGHDSGGPLEHPAPATTPRPVDPTTGLELSDDEHALVTGGLSKGDTVDAPKSPVVDNLLGTSTSRDNGVESAAAGAAAEAPQGSAGDTEGDDFKDQVLSLLERLSSKLGHLEHEVRHLGHRH